MPADHLLLLFIEEIEDFAAAAAAVPAFALPCDVLLILTLLLWAGGVQYLACTWPHTWVRAAALANKLQLMTLMNVQISTKEWLFGTLCLEGNDSLV